MSATRSCVFLFSLLLLTLWQSIEKGLAVEPADKASASSVGKCEYLTLEALFSLGQYEVEGVPSIQWSKRTSNYFRFEKSSEGLGSDLLRVDPSDGTKQIIAPARMFIPKGEKSPLKVDAFEFSSDETRLLIYTNSRRVWRRPTRGDYWVLDINSGELSKLGGDSLPSTLMFAKFSPDGKQVAYVRDHNLYVEDVSTHNITPLTANGSDTLINGTSDWVNEEELDLRDCFRWSPDGTKVLFWQFDTSGVAMFHMVNNTDSNEPRITSFAYPKVGSKNSAVRLGIVPVQGGSVQWLEVPGDPREHYLPHAEWLPGSDRIIVQQFNRLQSEQYVWLVDANSGHAKLLMKEVDSAWLENENPVRWLEPGKSFLWLSHRSGWRQAYRVTIGENPNGSAEPVPITQGDFDVMEIEGIDESNKWLYYAASPKHATERHLYRVRFDGSESKCISPDQPGWFKSEISPDGQWSVRTYSTFSTPPVVELVHQPDVSVVRTLADNSKLREKLDRLEKPDIDFFAVDIGDGISLDGWSIRPHKLQDGDKLPLIVHVYGEPHGQTVRNAWPGTRGLWHWYLAQQGYVVASVDNRGTNVPKGREWRKVVHHKIGIIAPQEQARAVKKLLARWPFVDESRVGVWGWSGGGSMSLNAIFRYPNLYRAAIAIAPVADQRLYDTIYQERYMGLPSQNAEGYLDGSPLTHAHKLRGHLLLIHGTGDDNCHYQGTERLMNELIAEGKQFSVLPYPNRTHSIREGQNTEFHLWSSMTRYFDEKLRSQPVEAQDRKRDQARRPMLQVFNGTADALDVYRLSESEDRVWVGAVKPGEDTILRSMHGQNYVAVNRNDHSESKFTCKVPIQAVRIGAPPAIYTQHTDASGFPIVASATVNPYALKEAAYIVDRMLAKRPDVRKAMIDSGARLSVIAYNEFTTDLPEWAWMAAESPAGFENIPGKDFWDARARGMGGSETDPYCSCGEENLLAYDGDPYSTENILIHELAHNIHLRGMNNVDPTFDARVKAAYESAKSAGLWHGKYASVNHHEYFAEGVQSWFDDNRENDHDHNHVNTREELLQYDPRLAELCREVFGDTEFRYTKPKTRLTGHLEGYDPSHAPKFAFPDRLTEVKKRIRQAAENRGKDPNSKTE